MGSTDHASTPNTGRIERLPGSDPDRGWRIQDGRGRTQVLGDDDASREVGPGGQVFAWWLGREEDPAGNAVEYGYRRDGGRLYLTSITWSIWSLHLRHELRPDIVRSARAGFMRTMSLRTVAIDLRCDRRPDEPLRTWNFEYLQAANGASLLRRIELSAAEGADRVAHPALTFGYADFDVADAAVEAISALVPPPPLDDSNAQLVDLDGEGLPDVLHLADGIARRWRNVGDGSLEGPFAMAEMPSLVSLARSNVALADLDGDGRADLFAVDQPTSMTFRADGRGGFEDVPDVAAHRPSVRLAEPATRLTDLNGDGTSDILWTGPAAFVAFHHESGTGWMDPVVVPRVRDLDAFPDVTFGDRGVRLADMTGDGLQDIVVIRSGESAYWPSLGHGRFGRRVDLHGAPLFPPGHRDAQVHLVDLDGDGCADVVYFGDEGTTVWINECGNGFAAPIIVPIAPPPGRRALAADMFGDGRMGFGWDASSRTHDDSGYRVLRFGASSPAPYLMTSIDNGLGGVSRMRYASSVSMRLRDEAVGRPWSGALPLVVHVLESLEQVDLVTDRVATTDFRYHDGVWDGPNREFRGFRSVTVVGGDPAAPMRQEVSFFQGDPDTVDLVERARQRALAGSPTGTTSAELVDGVWEPRQESEQHWTARVERDDGPLGSVWMPYVTAIETRELDPSGGPARVERTDNDEPDENGNPTGSRRTSFAAGAPAADRLVTSERTQWLAAPADPGGPGVRWLVHLPVQVTASDGDGMAFASRLTRYDGPAFEGLASGEATAGLMTSAWEARLLDGRVPAGHLDGVDLSALGFVRLEAPAPGWYARAQALRRDGRGNAVGSRDALGATTVTEFDADDVFALGATDTAGRAMSLTFDLRSCEPATVTVPGGRRTRSEFDALGRLVAQFQHDADDVEVLVKAWSVDVGSIPTSTTSFAPSAVGADRATVLAADPTSLPDITGVSVSRVFNDGFGNALVTASTVPGPPTEDGEPGPSRVALTDRVVLDARGLVVSRLGPSFAPDLSWPGAPTAAEIAAPSTQHTRYDASGLVVEVTDPGGVVFATVRAPFTISHHEGGLSGPLSRIERFDARGRLVRVEEHVGDGDVVVHAYDLEPDGRVNALRDADGSVVARWLHAGPADPVRIEQRDAGTRDYLRDASGRLVRQTGADGAALLYSFDILGRVTSVDHRPAGGAAERIRRIAYDADPDPAHPSAGRFLDGRVATLEEGPPGQSAVFRFSYDAAGRPIAEEQAVAGVTETIRREYDLQGRPTAVTYPDGTRVAYALHAGGAVVGVAGFADAIEYGADGSIHAYRLPGGGGWRPRTIPSRAGSSRCAPCRRRRGADPHARVRVRRRRQHHVRAGHCADRCRAPAVRLRRTAPAGAGGHPQWRAVGRDRPQRGVHLRRRREPAHDR